MRQVPKYAIIGAGRAANHIIQYFKLLDIPYNQWSRSYDEQSSLNACIADCHQILLLINDSVIDKFIIDNPILHSKKIVHFSGVLVSELAYGAHPLISFAEELYTLDEYQKIPFILDNDKFSFQQLLPGLDNPHFIISPALKPFYHSLCVLSGNFTVILWQKFFSDLEKKFNIPREFAHHYLQQICSNLQRDPQAALTGPLVRDDKATIEANLNALANDPFQKIYQSFVEVYNEHY